MGVDVNLYAEGEVTAAELAAAETFLNERGFNGWTSNPDVDGPVLRRDPSRYDEEAPRIEFLTLWRYYGPGYERGPWPQIYGAIRALKAALPRCTVFYGGDGTDDGEEATDELLASLWEHWLGAEGNAYHVEMRAWNVQKAETT